VVAYNDPFFPTVGRGRHYDLNMTSTPLDNLGQYDAVLIVTDHSAYDYPAIVEHSQLVVDTRNATKGIDSPKIVPLLKDKRNLGASALVSGTWDQRATSPAPSCILGGSPMTLLSATLAEPQHFSLAEKLLLIALTTASAAIFWRRFRVSSAKSSLKNETPGFRLSPIGPPHPRLCLGGRSPGKGHPPAPAPRLAHAFVFWGFCAFALVTLNHFAVASASAFSRPKAALAASYSWLAAAFALTCAASILGLFIRRFLIRPKWLGKLSWDSGIIALLIFILMATYLAAFFVAGAAPRTTALWAHTLALLIFLPIIPRTKHLHLVLSPASVFLSRGSFSRIPPLADDETSASSLAPASPALSACKPTPASSVGRCTEHCPASTTGKLLNPKEIILGLRDYLNDLGPASSEPLLGKYNAPEAPFQCTTCGACEFQCPVGIEHLPILIGLRRGAVNTGAWADDYGAKLFLALERGSELARPARQRAR